MRAAFRRLKHLDKKRRRRERKAAAKGWGKASVLSGIRSRLDPKARPADSRITP